MKITDNFSITKLFVDKNITITINKETQQEKKIILKAPTIKDLQLNDCILSASYMWGLSAAKIEELFKIKVDNNLSFVELIFFNGYFKEIQFFYSTFVNALNFLFSSVVYKKDIGLFIQDVQIDSEIWDYLVFIIKLSCGEKIEKPRDLSSISPAEKKWIEAQKKMQERIDSIKSKARQVDKDVIIKMLLSITYAFPALNFDYLFDQTMAQIKWLQKYAAESVSYNVNSMAYAAGNVKKNSKLDFFIK